MKLKIFKDIEVVDDDVTEEIDYCRRCKSEHMHEIIEGPMIGFIHCMECDLYHPPREE